MDIKDVFSHNKQWIASKLQADNQHFKKLAKGQSPGMLYIGCSDSRVSAQELLGLPQGEVFVHRNIANMVPNSDLNVMSVITYAVRHLKVSHVVVCGHYLCGGVRAAMINEDLGVLNPWLRNIRDVYRTHQNELDGIADEEKRYNRLVELNVQEQCINVIKTEVVQKAILERGLKVHGWVFNVQTGILKDLEIDFERILKKIMKIYRLS